MRDYTDACFRYLRATGMVGISQSGKSLYVLPDKVTDVNYFLQNVDRDPVYVEDETNYKAYLYNPDIPVLYTDNRENLIEQVAKIAQSDKATLIPLPTERLKDILDTKINEKKENIIREKVRDLKAYRQYQDILKVYNEITNRDLYDPPLMLEYNTWRAMIMLDGGNISANLKFDDEGEPMATASGNMADIVCDYGDFGLTVEVTLKTGQRQYEMEGEPITRHLGKLKRESAKDAYCLFIAPSINESCIAFFYTLYKTDLTVYGGKSAIIPLDLETFRKMLDNSYNVGYAPNPDNVKQLFEYSIRAAERAANETEWYNNVKAKAAKWPRT